MENDRFTSRFTAGTGTRERVCRSVCPLPASFSSFSKDLVVLGESGSFASRHARGVKSVATARPWSA